MKTILAIDGNSVINRAYFGVRPLTNSKGQRTEAIFGMLNIILSAVERLKPDSVQVAFDLHAPTFRHKMFDGYKGTRKGMDEELYCQMEPAKRLLRALGYKVLSLEGYEADDILGTISVESAKDGNRCCILTGDRDSLQLITEQTHVFLISKGETVDYDRARFFEKYGIMPEQFVDAKAIMGDSSDNIPGVAGIGEKTALPLIAKFGSLDGVYEHLNDPFIKNSARLKLTEGKESAYLSQTLARICVSVPIDLDFSDTVRQPELYEVLKDLGFSSFIDRLSVSAADGASAEKTREYQQISPDNLLKLAGKAGIYFNDDGLYVSSEEGDFFLPAPDPVTIALFFTPERKIAVHDCKSLYKRLYAYGITDFEAEDDPMLQGYVLSSTEGDYSEKALCLRYLNRISDTAGDAGLTLELSEKLNGLLTAEGAEHLYRDIELPLAGVLARCEKEGFLIDKEGIFSFSAALEGQINALTAGIYGMAEGEFNINSPKQLGVVLFERLGLPCPKKTKSGYSTSAEILDKLKGIHPIIEAILNYRQLAKLRSTYTEGLLKVAGADGRVHTCFTQTVTATGRLSSIEPNLQNIPVRTELGREMRRFFVAPKGKKLIDADYSQIELRLLADISGDETMIKAFRNGTDIHAVTASEVFGVPLEEVTSALRKQAKAVNFGIVYGISAYSLSEDLHIPIYQADDYIKGYFATYPKIEKYMKNAVASAAKDGYVKTMFGRKRYIPELTSGKGMLKKFGERVAMNSPIQGSAADIIKIAMVAVDHALKDAGLDAKLILQVHDELIVEASEKDAEQAADILKREMEHAVSLKVPLPVDLSIGDSWFDCK